MMETKVENFRLILFLDNKEDYYGLQESRSRY